MTTLMQNMKFAFRLLRKSPGFAFVAVVIMALGIGANTAIFSVVHAVLLEPLPFHDADRLVQVWHVPPQTSFPGMTRFAVSAANFLDWQKQNDVFEQMALYGGRGFDITGAGKPESIRAGAVTSDFFSVLGVEPLHGRVFLPEEDRPGSNHEVILSYKLWQSRYASDPNVIGKSINLDGDPYVIVGVMGPKMVKPGFAQIWTPLGLTSQEAAIRGNHNFLSVARLKPGVTLPEAQAAMNTISQRLEKTYPEDDKGWGAIVNSMREETVGDVRPALLMMFGAVAFVLLIACANVANLVLARTFARRKEIAIRSALGATRSRVVQQLLSESLIISVCGGALGLLVAHFGIQLLLKFFADKLPRMGEIGLDGSVLVFTFALSIATGVLSGILPALGMTKGDVNDALKQGLGRTDSDSGNSKTRSALVVIEVALSLVLLIGAGLMIRSLWKLQTIDPGFDEHNVLTLSVMVPKRQFTDPTQESQYFDEVLQRIRSLPGVESAGAVDNLPLTGGSNQPVAVAGRPFVAMSEQPEVSVRVATPGYIQTMHIPLLQGRNISADDTADSAPVVVISQSMAKQLWPNESPIGQHLKLSFYPETDRQDRRSRRRCKAVRPRQLLRNRNALLATRTGQRLLDGSMASTPSVPRRPHHDSSRDSRHRGNWRHQPGEQGHPCRQRHDAGRLCRRNPDTAQLQHAVAHDLRSARPCPLRHRHLQRACVFSEAPYERDRSAHRLRSIAARRRAPDHRSRHEANARGNRHRPDRSLLPGPRCRQRNLRSHHP